MRLGMIILSVMLATPLAWAEDTDRALQALNQAQSAAQDELEIPVTPRQKPARKKNAKGKPEMKSSMSHSAGFTL